MCFQLQPVGLIEAFRPPLLSSLVSVANAHTLGWEVGLSDRAGA